MARGQKSKHSAGDSTDCVEGGGGGRALGAGKPEGEGRGFVFLLKEERVGRFGRLETGWLVAQARGARSERGGGAVSRK